MKPSLELHGIRRVMLLVLALLSARYAVRALLRQTTDHTEPDAAGPPAQEPVVRMTASILTRGEPPPEPTARRGAIALAATMLFFAGIAVTAGAGDDPARLLEQTTEAAPATTGSTEAAPTTEAPQAEPTPEPAPFPEATLPPAPTIESSPEPAPVDEADPAGSSPASARRPSVDSITAVRVKAAAVRHRKPRVLSKATAQEEATAHGGASVIWLDRALPDPTPRARRLDRWFVYDLVRSSRAAKVDWALVLGVVRARGHGGRTPVDVFQLAHLAGRLRDAGAARDERAAAFALMGRSDLADEAVALAHYNRAVGTETLVRGLTVRKDALVRRLLGDRRVEIYPGGRDDLFAGRIDVRVVTLMSYLAESFGSVTVTSLFSGHRLYARAGVVSAHVYGHAVDIAALGGFSITGNQEPGGLAEQAVRSIMSVPAELQPRQVISLLGLGGASFPLADHHDHIHVGY